VDSNQDRDTKRPASDQLHPAICAALVGAAAWFALAIWGFDRDRYTAWLLVVVSGFTLIAVAIPTILSQVGHRPGRDGGMRKRFREWASGDFETWTDRSKGLNAAIEVLLPLGAIAVGMTAIVIVFLTEHAAS
jgi:hypothetical protein